MKIMVAASFGRDASLACKYHRGGSDVDVDGLVKHSCNSRIRQADER